MDLLTPYNGEYYVKEHVAAPVSDETPKEVTFNAESADVNVFGNGGNVDIPIKSASGDVITQAFLEVDLTVASASVYPTCMPLWAEHEYFPDQSSTELCTHVPEALLSAVNTYDSDTYRSNMRDLFMNAEYQPEGALPVGTRTFRMELLLFPFLGLPLFALKDNALMRLKINTTTGILESGTAANLTIAGNSSVRLVLRTRISSPAEKIALKKLYDNSAVNFYVPHTDKITYSPTLTAASDNPQQLTQIYNSRVAMVQIYARASQSLAAGAARKPLRLGDEYSDGTIALESADGSEITKNWDVQHQKQIASAKYSGTLHASYPGIVEINHCKDPNDWFRRRVKGRIYSGKEQLNIVPGAYTAATDQVLTYTPSATITAGSYFFVGREAGNDKCFIVGPLAHSATTAQIDAAFVAARIPHVTFTSSGTIFSAGAGGLVITMSNLRPNFLTSNGFNLVCVAAVASAGPVTAYITSAVTTAGVCLQGFNTAAVKLDLIVYRIRKLQWNRRNPIVTKNLM